MTDQQCPRCGVPVPPTNERCDECGAWQAELPPVTHPEPPPDLDDAHVDELDAELDAEADADDGEGEAAEEAEEQLWWDPGEPSWAKQPITPMPSASPVPDPQAPAAYTYAPAEPVATGGGAPAPAPTDLAAYATGAADPGAPPPPPPPPGYPAAPPGFGPPPPESRSRRTVRTPVLVAAAIAACVGLVATGSAVLIGHDSGPSYPDRWDPRVASIASWVEKERDLHFSHPVYVDFLTPAQYRAAATGADAEEQPTPEDHQLLQSFGASYRSIGLGQGDIDLEGSLDEVSDTGTLAFYSPDDKRVRVRGTALTPDLRVTLAHELTHALQDQNFNLDGLYDDSSSLQPDSYDTQLRAVVEGDAMRIEERYVEDQLTSAERDAYEQESEDEGEQANEQLDDAKVPPGLLATFSAPYWFGSRFVTLLEQERGSEAVDQAIRIPPSSSEQMFDPLTYLRDDRPADVDPVEVPAGATVINQGPFGSVQWYLMLAERISPEIALRAVDGWGGDNQTIWTKGGKTCVGAHFTGDTPEDDDEMYDALTRWQNALPEGMATVDKADGLVSFESCDPGAKADLDVTGRSGDALVIPAVRTDIVTVTMADGADADLAGCYGTRLVSSLTVKQLTDDDTEAFFASDQFKALVNDARARCA